MVKPSLKAGSIVDGFQIEDRVHQGGMATLWRVARVGDALPMLMKVPKLGEGEDPGRHCQFRNGTNDPASAVRGLMFRSLLPPVILLYSRTS